jgi:hypothetical protein
MLLFGIDKVDAQHFGAMVSEIGEATDDTVTI